MTSQYLERILFILDDKGRSPENMSCEHQSSGVAKGGSIVCVAGKKYSSAGKVRELKHYLVATIVRPKEQVFI